MFQTYRPSGKFGAMTMPLWLLALVVTVPLSIAYVVLLEVIPLIYVSVILTLVAGWLLGLAAYFACKWGACQEPDGGLVDWTIAARCVSFDKIFFAMASLGNGGSRYRVYGTSTRAR